MPETNPVGHDDHLMEPELRSIMLDQRGRNALRPALSTLDPILMRQRASAELNPWNADAPELAVVRDFSVPTVEHAIPVRLYDPSPDRSSGILVYFHGGGWIIGDLDLEDGALRHIAARGGFKIVSVDYRLAPEHGFPAAVEDGESVLHWIAEHHRQLNADPKRIAVGGSSAGANVAIGSALRIRDNGGPVPASMALLFGAYSGGDGQFLSRTRFGDGRFGLPSAAMEMFWSLYLGDERNHPHAAPLKADLHDLPAALIVAAELDILADESRELADRLRKSGAAVDFKFYEGGMHGFTHYFRVSPLARKALADIADGLAAVLVDQDGSA